MKAEELEKTTWYHGTKEVLTSLKLGEGGGIHVGSLDQAKMRSGGKCVLKVKVRAKTFKRLKDRPFWKKETIQRAKQKGYDGIIYLNRHEGISVETVDRLRAMNLDIDSIPDSRFRHLVPEANDSLIIFDESCVAVIEEAS